LLDLQAAKLTDVGRARPHNEDYVDYYIPPEPQQLSSKGAIYLVADGMGGHQAGEVASQGAVELTIAQYYSDTANDVGTSLVRAIRSANRQIYDQAESDLTKVGMGTTLVAAVVLGQKVYVGNVGDSRAYIINSSGIIQITEDHSWVEEQVRAGLLTPEQARRHPQRNLVTRALGSKPDVQVDLFEGEIKAGDTLLLCSDGLTGRVRDNEIASIVRSHQPEEAARQLIVLANERGGNDNITVLIVQARDEAVTIKAPLVAPADTKPARSPLAPILGGAVAVVLLLLVGGGIWWLLGGGPGPRRTPTPTLTWTAMPATPTHAATPTETAAAIATATITPTATLLVPGTATSTMTPTPTETGTSTSTPTLTVTEEPTATETLAATVAPAATETSTVTVTTEAAESPTHTPSPSPTPTLTPTSTPTQ
jgi:serine/threonine protein phosphatase PrpC